MGNAFSAIILIGVVIIVVVVIAVLLLRSTPNPVTNVPTPNPGSLSQPCAHDPTNTTPNIFGSTGICGAGYICETNNICVADLGTLCNTLTDCSSQATVCSGRCSTEATGGINKLCPCGPLSKCVPQPDGYNRCKGTSGAPCVLSSDCIGQCINGFCSGGLQEGSPCISQLCEKGSYCDAKGFCQQIPFISGQQNAFCAVTGEPTCDPGLRCVDNRCASTFGVLGSNCKTQFCNQPLICTSVPALPGTPTSYSACLFNDNNICITNCPGNFSCTTVGLVKKCLGNVGQACIANNNCVNNNCASMSGLLKWTGTTWSNISTPPSEIFTKLRLGNGVAQTPSNVYALGSTGLWRYNGTWSLLFSKNLSIGTIIDFSVNGVNDNIHLLITTIAGITIIVDSNLNPIGNFGTANGALVIGSTVIVIANFSFNNFGEVYCNTASGNVYKNATFLGNFGTKITAYNASNSSANDFAVINGNGVFANGELGNLIFPLFPQPPPPMPGAIYNKIANYDMYVEYIPNTGSTGITGITGSTGCTGTSGSTGSTCADGSLIVNAATSNIIMIASPDAINYQILVNTSNIQTPYPGYVNANSLVATNKVDIYLLTPKICN
jgi:hypothetical protein